MSEYYSDDNDFGPLFKPATPKTAPPPEYTNVWKLAILARVQKGPATCRQIDRLTPARGQALVHSMRQDGHKIKTVMIDNTRCYVYRGFSERIRVAKSMQVKYYESSHWRKVAYERKQVDGFRCRQCGSGGSQASPLETHHWVYELFAEEVNTELITLCRTCHQQIHEWIKGGACHFPHYVDDDTARQLGWEPATDKADR